MKKMTSAWHPSAPSFAMHALTPPVKNGILERATVKKKQGEIKKIILTHLQKSNGTIEMCGRGHEDPNRCK